jgi:HlyD family secretion protein
MQKKIMAGIGIAAVLIAGMVFSLRGGDTPLYRTETIDRGTIRSFCTATGTVNPLKKVLVGTQVSGRIKALHADFNAPVEEGELIAEIDPATFEAQLEQARANLLAARAQLVQAEAVLKDSERRLRRSRELFAARVIGQSELDAADTDCEVSRSAVGAARAQVIQSEAAFKYAETNLRYTRIYSPVDGIVISRDVDVGQTVAATFQTPTLFTIAGDLRNMQINTSVDEADIGKIEVGQEAAFTVDAYPDTVFAGVVDQVRNAPVVVQTVVTYDVIITVDNSNLLLKPGMTATVTIYTAAAVDVLRVPNAALRFRPERGEDEGRELLGSHVWVSGAGGIEPVMIRTGIDDFTFTEVREGALAEGQAVIVGYMRKAR